MDHNDLDGLTGFSVGPHKPVLGVRERSFRVSGEKVGQGTEGVAEQEQFTSREVGSHVFESVLNGDHFHLSRREDVALS